MKKYRIIMVLAGIAIVNAMYLSYKAYIYHFINPYKLTTICDFSGWSSCTDVLRNPLSLVFGIPFPWVAFVVYPILLGLAWYGYRKSSYVQAKVLTILSGMGMCFNGFIIYREIRFIHAYCILCLICTTIIVSIFILSLQLTQEGKNELSTIS
ncbi:MAG: hypothetical protein COZ86_04280 [Candidatus Moranbacteria bacterium CG_4_8_14_3_um_filter_41_13]|nr:MAG: hypothetical protein AUK58_02805 [Candidatus Moranbacteria bacterium CG2_30_41_165]PIW93841.1 MAG: hypothetical protein COZ86_04280 [Candidatus Moranbacteria bacterium CG_4_8_14_3_um_filter_41_13]PJC00435.1 MAG: hypothetical protein CO075_00670 [Candidatus Moranbacteria bacterium CG_4_9_14_0_8_um_filter_41_43]HCJ45569.1 hypothetical protein [Candidatus Moranbacteria bacterium]